MSENLIDAEMELISRSVCTTFAYDCFQNGFHGKYAGKFTAKQSQDIEDWSLDLFQHDNDNDWVIWFVDMGGDENYFGEFWLIFTEEKLCVAENAYKSIGDFLREHVGDLGKVPPYILEEKLYKIFDSIWGK